MGKRGKKFGGGRPRPAVYEQVVKQSESYENYYNALSLVPEEEKEQFWEALRRNLPHSFRFTGSRRHALAVQQRLIDLFIPEITAIEYEGAPVEPPRPIPWFPDQLAWSMTTPKNVIRRFAPFASFQRFLVSETEVGNISRQEVVSMIPPLLLDIKPGTVVLDMCAAPGSKAAQIMEMIHAGEEERMEVIARKREATGHDNENTSNEEDVAVSELFPADAQQGVVDDDGRSTGLLIANDSDYKRSHLLIHQMKRLNSPNLIVTNHDATMYPSIKLHTEPTAEGKSVLNRYLKFDRILADVPCSGDGTTRKNVNVWKDWNPANGIGLHLTQSRILVRALQMLKVGGRVVYSTCSMNPVENEAVIAGVIERCGGSSKVNIVDCSDKLPELKRSPGLTTWKVVDKQGNLWETWKDIEDQVQENSATLGKVTETMFPPTEGDEELDLSRCIRVYPHQQDTGAFFITVLEKKGEIRARPEGTPKNATSTSTGNEETQRAASPPKRKADQLDSLQETKRVKTSDPAVDDGNEPPAAAEPNKAEMAGQKPIKRGKPGQPIEEPFRYLDPQLEDIQRIFDFYSISPRFPRDRFMVRNSEGRPAKIIYYTSVLGREILTENEGTGIKFVHCGVKMFVKQEVQGTDVCPWRIQTDGLQILESWVGRHRIVKLHKKETLRKLLIEMFPRVNNDGWRELGEVGDWARDASMGCYVLRIEPSESDDGFQERMVFPVWRSLHSLNLMLPKEDRRALLLRLFDDDTPLINVTAKKADADKIAPDTPPRGANGEAETEGTVADDDLPTREEEEAIKRDSLVLGQEEQEHMNSRESYVKAGDEADVMNTTV